MAAPHSLTSEDPSSTPHCSGGLLSTDVPSHCCWQGQKQQRGKGRVGRELSGAVWALSPCLLPALSCAHLQCEPGLLLEVEIPGAGIQIVVDKLQLTWEKNLLSRRAAQALL